MSLPEAVETRIAGAPLSAHLATAVDDRPHLAPVWYGSRDGSLYFITGGRSSRTSAATPAWRSPSEDARGGDVAWNTTYFGTATVTTDPDRLEWADGWIYDAYDDAPDADPPDADPPPDDGTAAGGRRVDDSLPDGGVDDTPEYALVEVSIGSTSLTVDD